MLFRSRRFLIDMTRRLLHALVAMARRAWRSHQRLLRESAAYAAAIAAGAAAIVTQDGGPDLVATVLATALAIYAAVRRGDALR